MIQISTNMYCILSDYDYTSNLSLQQGHSLLVCETATWMETTDGPVDRKDCINMEEDGKPDRVTGKQTQ